MRLRSERDDAQSRATQLADELVRINQTAQREHEMAQSISQEHQKLLEHLSQLDNELLKVSDAAEISSSQWESTATELQGQVSYWQQRASELETQVAQANEASRELERLRTEAQDRERESQMLRQQQEEALARFQAADESNWHRHSTDAIDLAPSTRVEPDVSAPSFDQLAEYQGHGREEALNEEPPYSEEHRQAPAYPENDSSAYEPSSDYGASSHFATSYDEPAYEPSSLDCEL